LYITAYYNPKATTQQKNQTTAGWTQNNTNNDTGIGNVKTTPKIANLLQK